MNISLTRIFIWRTWSACSCTQVRFGMCFPVTHLFSSRWPDYAHKMSILVLSLWVEAPLNQHLFSMWLISMPLHLMSVPARGVCSLHCSVQNIRYSFVREDSRSRLSQNIRYSFVREDSRSRLSQNIRYSFVREDSRSRLSQNIRYSFVREDSRSKLL